MGLIFIIPEMSVHHNQKGRTIFILTRKTRFCG